MNMKRLLAAALSAALLLALTACGSTDADGGQTDGSGPSGVAVQVEEVLDGTIFAENTVSGKIEPEDQATIMVAVNAKCTKVYAEAGDIVQAGQALCTLDLGSTLSSYNAANISYQSSVQGYQDQSAVFEMQIALLEKTVQDLKELFAIGAASQMEIDQRGTAGNGAGKRRFPGQRHCAQLRHAGDDERRGKRLCVQRGPGGHH